MKSTLAMLGLAAAGNTDVYYKLTTASQAHGTDVWGLRSVNEHKADSDTQIEFGDHATGMADARPPLRSHLMTMAEAMDTISNKPKAKKGKKAAKKAKHSAKPLKKSKKAKKTKKTKLVQI